MCFNYSPNKLRFSELKFIDLYRLKNDIVIPVKKRITSMYHSTINHRLID